MNEESMSAGSNIGEIILAMVLVSALEFGLPLRARNSWNRIHLAPNLALTVVAFALNALFNGALVSLLVWLHTNDLGLLNVLHPPTAVRTLMVLLLLDLATYGAVRVVHSMNSPKPRNLVHGDVRRRST
jgi:hypothetical protein